MKRWSFFLSISALGLALTGNVFAASISYDDSSPVDVYSISTYDTDGSSMTGMMVTVNFSNGTTQQAAWDPTLGASTSDWSLTLNDYSTSTYTDTVKIGALWTLDNKSTAGLLIQTISIDAIAGGTVFDVINYPMDSTNSGYGWAIDWTKYSGVATNTSFTATYSNPVGLNGVPPFNDTQTYNTPIHDLYGTLTIDFGPNYFLSTDVLSFYADTDNTAVPEPISLILFGSGLIGLTGYNLKRKKTI